MLWGNLDLVSFGGMFFIWQIPVLSEGFEQTQPAGVEHPPGQLGWTTHSVQFEPFHPTWQIQSPGFVQYPCSRLHPEKRLMQTHVCRILYFTS